MDIVSKAKRSEMMAGIKSYDTKPELLIRKALHSMGYRFRINDKSLPGKPDIVFPKYKAVVFIHGCFWHKHDCSLFKWPKSRSDFWKKKIMGNVVHDIKVKEQLLEMGWRVGVVWECAVKGVKIDNIHDVATQVAYWLKDDTLLLEVKG